MTDNQRKMNCFRDIYKDCTGSECPFWVPEKDLVVFQQDVRDNLSGAPLCPSQCSLTWNVYYQEKE